MQSEREGASGVRQKAKSLCSSAYVNAIDDLKLSGQHYSVGRDLLKINCEHQSVNQKRLTALELLFSESDMLNLMYFDGHTTQFAAAAAKSRKCF